MRRRRQNYKQYLHTAVSIICSLIILCADVNRASALSEKCDTCKDIVKKFDEGIQKTQKSSFGGGNTKWEERALGSYATSETRLVEITETLCGSDNKCHKMLEDYEEMLEEYWFEQFGKKTGVDMQQWFCVEQTKVCCPEHSYGPTCTPCPGGERICSGNGDCNGDGTREGTGKCDCHHGYQGEQCMECIEGFYPWEQNDTHITCRSCHKSCKSGCTKPGPEGCVECISGWKMGEAGCVDVDECEEGTSHCGEGEFCDNSDGSYQCGSCDNSCDGCTAPGPTNCKACKEGYRQVEDVCKDIDECEENAELCDEKTFCLNFPGSYSCKDCDVSCDGCTGSGPADCKTCALGFTQVEDRCEDIDECEENPCEGKGDHLRCDNSPGSHTCVCTEGYKMNDAFKCIKKRKVKEGSLEEFMRDEL
ncbi:hypothetical protein ScPMuIL_008485 [Solemya velum]